MSGSLSGRSICVYCGAGAAVPAHYLVLASEVGRGIAERGWQLVSGGEHVSMMGAVARAARAGGARTLGIITPALLTRADPDAELLVAPTMRERKALMASYADAFLTLPGGIGTCEELFETWIGRVLAVHVKPLVLLDPDGHYTGLLRWLEDLSRRGFVTAAALGTVVVVSTVVEALDACCLFGHDRELNGDAGSSPRAFAARDEVQVTYEP